MTNAHPVYYTLEEYVAFEDSNPAKHEYLGGQIFAMAGGSAEHARLAAAVGAMIGAKLPAGCRMFSSDLRIRIDSANLTTYPDGVVICGNPILAPGPDKYAYSNPRVVIEVLSPTTERYDRGDKLLYYQSLPSVQEVLLVIRAVREGRGAELRQRFGRAAVMATFGSAQSA